MSKIVIKPSFMRIKGMHQQGWARRQTRKTICFLAFTNGMPVIWAIKELSKLRALKQGIRARIASEILTIYMKNVGSF
jgi:hypothetical protein